MHKNAYDAVEPGFTTLVDIARWRAYQQPDARAYAFLTNGEIEGAHLTYSQLDQKARSIAVTLQRQADPGDRALLLYPAGLDYIAAYLGCLYAGIIAVPAYPPSSKRSFGRIQAITKDCQARLCLTVEQTLTKFTQWRQDLPDMENMAWIATDNDQHLLPADQWQEYQPQAGEVAFLQYTSGSTGTPKGVIVTHSNLMHNLSAIQQALNLTSDDICVSWLPIFHDMGLIAGVLLSLYTGFPTILMAPAAFVQRPLRWLSAISHYRGTVSYAPNFAYELCVQRITGEERASLDLSCWRVSCNGAEPIRKESVDNFYAVMRSCGFKENVITPGYGLAEGTLMVSAKTYATPMHALQLFKEQLAQNRVVISPVANEMTRPLVSNGPIGGGQRVEIVYPESQTLCPAGVVGEIWVAGQSVARGYWQRPVETQQTFGAFLQGTQGTEGGPFLRTGDLGFMHAGEVYVTGRLKDIIIIRGRNHYPQDIELTAEQAHASLRPGGGAAFVIDEEQVEKLVIVHEVQRDHADVQEIFRALRQEIAEQHEVQIYAVVLIRFGSLLKTSSGKIQRRACRQAFLADELTVIASDIREQAPAPQPESHISPATLLEMPAEEQVMALQSYLLALLQRFAQNLSQSLTPDVAINSIGLDSLQAAQLRSCIEDELAVTLPFTEFLQETTPADLTITLLQHLKRQVQGKEHSFQLPLPHTEALSAFALSLAQEQLWILNQLEPANPFYNISLALELKGPLTFQYLEQSLKQIAQRHSALRTTFHEQNGKPFLMIHADSVVKPILIDLRDIPNSADRPGIAQRIVELTTRQPFDLARSPLWHLFLLQVEDDLSVLLIVMHHIISDGWSTGIFLKELTAIYSSLRKGEAPVLSPLRTQYSDYMYWQQSWVQSAAYAAQLAYWKQQLSDLPILELPTDRKRPALQSYRGAIHRFTIAPDLKRRCKELSQQESATLFMFFLAAFHCLLCRYTGQEDIVVGTVVANRSSSALGEIIGYFVNTLVMRTHCSSVVTFRAFLQHVRTICLEAYANQEFPFTKLVEELRPVRDPGLNPLFQVMFTWQPNALDGLAMPDLTLHAYNVSGTTAKFDLTIDMIEGEQSLEGIVEYNTDLFDATTIEGMIAHYCVLLESIIQTPDQQINRLPLLTTEEYTHSLAGNLPVEDVKLPSTTLYALFEEQVQKTPDAIAVIYGMEQMTYYELRQRSHALAAYLRMHTEGMQAPVGIFLERSPDLMVSLFGIIKAGCVYVPLDPAYPQERLNYMLADARMQAVITRSSYLPDLPATNVPYICLDSAWAQIAAQDFTKQQWPEIGEGQLYIIYTSGSTGQPKGAGVYQHSFVNLLQWYRYEFQFGCQDRSLIISSFSFDLTQKNFFAPLLAGGSVSLLPSAIYDGALITTLIQEQAITILNCTPSAFYPLVTLPELNMQAWWTSLRYVFMGGEPISLLQLQPWLAQASLELVNTYGPTECTDVVSFYRLAEPAAFQQSKTNVPIGSPIWQASLLVLDRDLNRVPRGAIGELYIGGLCVGAGYLSDAEMTASHFIPDPFSVQAGQRLYRTGDLVRGRNDGSLEFYKRMDHQVKVRGFRVDLLEIEHALDAYTCVQRSVVLVREDIPGNAYLVAYVVLESDGAALAHRQLKEDIYSSLREKLTNYMLPSHIVILDALPFTPNGKLDRRALPPPQEFSEVEEATAPRTPLEEMVAKLWMQLLNVSHVGVHDDFFLSGGHSLLGTQLISRIKNATKIDLTLRHLFEAPTIARLASCLQVLQHKQPEAGQQKDIPPLTLQVRPLALPLSFAQQRLWVLYQIMPDSAAYAALLPIHLNGKLHIEAVERSLKEIIQRHEILRTNFVMQRGQAAQLIHATCALSFPIIDLQGLPGEKQRAYMEHTYTLDTHIPFNLSSDTLLRARLFRLHAEEHILALTIHHIIFDGWSQWILLKEFAQLYEAYAANMPSPLQDLLVQYADFTLWQRGWLRDAIIEKHLAYWVEKLRGARALDIVGDFPRAAHLSQQGASDEFCLPAALTANLKALCQREGVTLFMVLFSAFQTLLYRYTEQEDIVVGTDIANRTNTESEALIGFFVNLLALRTNFAGQPTFLDILRSVRETVLEAFAHQDVPFDKVVDALQLERIPGHLPLIQVLFVFQNMSDGATDVQGVAIRPQVVGVNSAKFDLAFFLWETQAGLAGGFNYSTTLFQQDTIRRMGDHFSHLLEDIVTNPAKEVKQLDYFTEAEKEQLLTQQKAQQDTQRKKLKVTKRQEITLSSPE